MCAAALASPGLSLVTHRDGYDCAAAQQIERELLIRYHDGGDLAAGRARTTLPPLAQKLAGRYAYTDEPLDDLLQVASLGLIKAIDRFEPGRG